jgi:hypothetical protein
MSPSKQACLASSLDSYSPRTWDGEGAACAFHLANPSELSLSGFPISLGTLGEPDSSCLSHLPESKQRMYHLLSGFGLFVCLFVWCWVLDSKVPAHQAWFLL